MKRRFSYGHPPTYPDIHQVYAWVCVARGSEVHSFHLRSGPFCADSQTSVIACFVPVRGTWTRCRKGRSAERPSSLLWAHLPGLIGCEPVGMLYAKQASRHAARSARTNGHPSSAGPAVREASGTSRVYGVSGHGTPDRTFDRLRWRPRLWYFQGMEGADQSVIS
jgi:hypothetical protein